MASKVTRDEQKITAAPAVVVKKTVSVPATRRVEPAGEPFSLLEFVASGRARLPRQYRDQRAFFRFLRKACSDKVIVDQVQRFRDAVILSAISAEKHEKRPTGGLTIAVAGPSGGEGASFVATMLALSLGSCKNRRIAVLDGNFDSQRFRAMTDVLDLSKNSVSLNKGSSQILGFYNESQPNLYFLKSASNESDLDFFSDKQLRFFLSDLRQQFDFTIIDMPALLNGSSGIFLAPAVDRLYLVSSAGRTKKSEVDRCVDIARQAGAEISGVIVNQQKTPLWSKAFFKDFFY